LNLIPDSIDFSAYMDEPIAQHKVEPAASWAQDVIDHFYKPDDGPPRVRMGWKKTQGDFNFRPGEVTLWGGINGHGKSQLVGQVCLDLMHQDQKLCIASLEMAPVRVMGRMVRQANGSSVPPVPYIKQFHGWTEDRLWLYDHVGSSNPKTMLAVIRYAVDKFGIQHFVVDNLAKVIAGEDDYNEQKKFVNDLCMVAHDTNVHVHLVLHVKKGKSEDDIPGKFDIKGSGSITDLVDNVFIVWRNKKKEAALRDDDNSLSDMPDAVLVLEKQRNGETEGKYNLWFDGGSLQYLEHRHDLVRMYSVETGVSADKVVF